MWTIAVIALACLGAIAAVRADVFFEGRGAVAASRFALAVAANVVALATRCVAVAVHSSVRFLIRSFAERAGRKESELSDWPGEGNDPGLRRAVRVWPVSGGVGINRFEPRLDFSLLFDEVGRHLVVGSVVKQVRVREGDLREYVSNPLFWKVQSVGVGDASDDVAPFLGHELVSDRCGSSGEGPARVGGPGVAYDVIAHPKRVVQRV